jgi:predicted hydrocarbon binding protein
MEKTLKMSISQKSLRNELGGFNSTICTKAIVVGIEEALGEKAAAIALVMAGRQRGKGLAKTLGLEGKGVDLPLEELAKQGGEALGKDGTRLCIIDKVEETSNDDENIYLVYTRETICSAGEEEGSSRLCTYTLGAVQGFLEALLNKRLRGEQVESVLRGSDHDVFKFTELIRA